MTTNLNLSGDYFDTPARAERLQLLLHLVRNAGEVLYLRAPDGSGKTRFTHQLLDILGDEMETVWVQAEKDCDIPSVAVDQLGLSSEDVRPWPDAVMAGLPGQELLLIVDDADRLGLEAVESLAQLHARGGGLLLVGQGGLAQIDGNWDVQFVDLPAFDAAQTTAFLRNQAGEQAARVTDDLAAGLHRAANGLPGPLLDALNGVLGSTVSARRVRKPTVSVPEGPGRPLWPWAFGGVVLIVLLSVLLFQDQINALLEPPGGSDSLARTVKIEPSAVEGSAQPAPFEAPAGNEKLRADAVSALMPEIDLPQPTQEPVAAEIDAASRSAQPDAVAPATDTDPKVAVSVQPPQAEAEAVDPLDAVMQDALAAAAEAGRPAENESSESPADSAAKASEKVQTGAAAKQEPVAKPRPMPAPAPAKPETAETAATLPAPVEEHSPTKPAGSVPENDGSAVRDTVASEPVSEASEIMPAPVETRQPATAGPQVAAPRTVPVTPAPSTDEGTGWLTSRSPGRYTLQLVGSRDRTAVQKFVRKHGIQQPYAIFARDLKGKPWFSLVAGDYPDRDAAVAARAQLPGGLKQSGVWPRTFESIIKSM